MEQTPKPAEAPKPKKNTMLLAVIVIVILVVVGVAAYILTKPSTPTACTSSSTLSCIAINDDGICATNATACAFSPANVTIPVNTMATWTNNGAVAHTVFTCSSANHPDSAQCPSMNAGGLPSYNQTSTIAAHGGTYSFTFSQAGHYYYYCSIHQWMHAEIIVQ